MKFKNPFVACFSLAVVILATQIGGAESMDYDFKMSSLGFADVTINGTAYKDLEVVLNQTYGKILGGCPDGFVPASASIMKALPMKDLFCRTGVVHEANESAANLSSEEASKESVLKEKIKELEFHWNLDGKRLETVHADDVWVTAEMRNTRALQLHYYTKYHGQNLKAVVYDKEDRNPICCMRHPYLPAATITASYPKYPTSGLGRHDVTINGHHYKNVPYVRAAENFCPDGMKKAILTNKESFAFQMDTGCTVSAAFVGSPTPLSGEDPNDFKVKRSRFQWIFDGKPAGVIPDELWAPEQPRESLEYLQNISVWLTNYHSAKGLETTPYLYNHGPEHPCCMDLTQGEPSTTTVEATTAKSAVFLFEFSAILFSLVAIVPF